MKPVSLIVLSLLVTTLGCDGGASSTSGAPAANSGSPANSGAAAKPGSTAAPAGATSDPAASAPDFSPWDLAAIRTAIAGTYVFKFNGSWQAWDLRGADATLYGDVLGKKGEDTTATVELLSPCQLSVKTGTPETGTSTSFHTFTVKDGFFPGGSGGIGVKKGDEIAYCESSDVLYRFGKAGCSKWKREGKRWSRSDAKCGLRDHDSKPAFWTDIAETEPMYRNVIDGDSLFPGASTPTPPLRLKDLAAAKAKVAELEKAK